MSDPSFNIYERDIPWGQLVEFVEAPTRTVRNWHNKYFPDLGEKQKNSRLLFSVLDCIVIRIFSTLVRKLSMQVDMAAEISISSRDYLTEKATSEDFTQKVIYFVISDTDSAESKYEAMDQKGLKIHTEKTNLRPYTVIPIDITYFALMLSITGLTNSIRKAGELAQSSSDEEYIEIISSQLDEISLKIDSQKQALQRYNAKSPG